MKFKLISNRMLISDNKFAGYNNENRAELLEFEFPENLKDYTKTINFRTPEGNFFDILDGDTYTLKNNITKYDKVYFYIEFKKQVSETEYEVIKTEVKTLNFNSSFNVDKEISEEEINILDSLIIKIDEATKRANAISQDLEEKVANDYYRGPQGIQGPQGPKGETGSTGPQGIQGNSGPDGKDGISATHNWNGTVLTITSASGTSSADLKGEKGIDGYTPEINVDYWTEQDKEEIITDVMSEVQPQIDNIEEVASKAETIAKGRTTGYVFDTLEDLDVWLQDEANISKLVLGDNLYIRAIGVPDYWWDGSEKQQLETQKVDLTEYINDVQINGQSIVANGVANIPIASRNTPLVSGLVSIQPSYGITTNSLNVLMIGSPSSESEISKRKSNSSSRLDANNIDYVVKTAMCDGVGAEWTDEEKANARARLGIGEWELIEKIVIEEQIAEFVREVEPDGTPYNFRGIYIRLYSPNTNGVHGGRFYFYNSSGTNLFSPAITFTAGNDFMILGIAELFGSGIQNPFSTTISRSAGPSNFSVSYTHCIDEHINKINLRIPTNEAVLMKDDIVEIYGMRW